MNGGDAPRCLAPSILTPSPGCPGEFPDFPALPFILPPSCSLIFLGVALSLTCSSEPACLTTLPHVPGQDMGTAAPSHTATAKGPAAPRRSIQNLSPCDPS